MENSNSVAADYRPLNNRSNVRRHELHTHPLWERTRLALAELGIGPTSNLLIGVSGGPDSMALLHILLNLKELGAIAGVTIAHLNHLLRPSESEKDETLVRDFARDWHLPIKVKRIRTKAIAARKKTGIEETARNIRYKFFEGLLMEGIFDCVITAHTANDQAETVIMNVVRGTGVRGLSGIPPKRKLGSCFVIRPWLDVAREDILEYIAEHSIEVAHDSSNDEMTYQRNRVRHSVIPALKEIYPGRSPIKSLAQLAGRMRDIEAFLNEWTKKQLSVLRNDNGLLLSALEKIHSYPFYTILEEWINTTPISTKAGKFGIYRLTAAETRRIEQFIASDHIVLGLRRALRLRKDSGLLRIEHDAESMMFEPTPLLLDKPSETPYGTFSASIIAGDNIAVDSTSACFDADQLASANSFLIRPWKKADLLVPFGMRGKRKHVSDLLTEARITGERRKHYPIVESGGCIMWVAGIRAANAAHVTPETKRMLKLEFKPRK